MTRVNKTSVVGTVVLTRFASPGFVNLASRAPFASNPRARRAAAHGELGVARHALRNTKYTAPMMQQPAHR